MSWFILQVLPYITVTVFTLGILYRLGRWAGARIVHNITLAPFPQNNSQVVGIFATEVIFFRSLFKSDFALWVGAWVMHIALFSVIGGHLMGIYTLGKQFVYIGMSEGLSEAMSSLLGTTFGIVVFFALLYLLFRRMSIQKVKEVTVTSDYLILILLLSIVTAGDIMRLVPSLSMEYAPAKEYVTYLVMLQPIPATAEVLHNVIFVIHLLLVQLLLIIFPFSKLMHILGMFAERWIINRPYTEPAPGLPNVDVPAARAAGLGLPAEGGVE